MEYVGSAANHRDAEYCVSFCVADGVILTPPRV